MPESTFPLLTRILSIQHVPLLFRKRQEYESKTATSIKNASFIETRKLAADSLSLPKGQVVPFSGATC